MMSVGGTDKGKTSRQRVLGERIREHRRRVGLTQEQLAYLADIHRSYVGQLEMGYRNPSVETLARLALALGSDIADLTRGLQDVPGRS